MILNQKDQHNQSVVQAIWTKTVKIVETLFLTGVLLIPLHFLVGFAAVVCAFGKFYSPPPWLWIELKVLVYPSTLIIWFRLLSTVSTYKLRSSQKMQYIRIFISSSIALVLALNPFVWYSNFAFPLLSVTYTVLFIFDTRLPAKSRRKQTMHPVTQPSTTAHTKKPLYARQKQVNLSQESIDEFFAQTKQTKYHTPTGLSQKVGIWYSPIDEKFATRLRTHLQPKIRQGEIDLWDASQIQPGTLLQNERVQAIKSAAVAVVLVSTDLMACDAIAFNELPSLLNRAMSQGTVILSIHVSPCDFEGSGLEKFHPINPPNKPLTSLGRTGREEVWTQATHAICQRLGISA